MTTFYMGEGGIVPKAVYTDMNTVLNKKLGTSTAYTPEEWADIVKDFAPLPEKTASGSIASFSDGADLVPLKSCEVTVTPSQSGTGDPSPSNPRPLNSFSSLALVHTKTNRYNSGVEIGNISATGQNTDSSNPNRARTINPIPVSASTQYTVGQKENYQCGVFYYKADGTFISYLGWDSTPRTFTTPALTAFVRFAYQITTNVLPAELQLQEGATLDPYEIPTTHTLDLGSTVYGVTGDCTSGEFEKTWVDLYIDGSVSVSSVVLHGGSGLYYTVVVNPLSQKGVNSTATFPHIISDKFLGARGVEVGHTYVTGSGLILIAVLPDQTITTKEGATQWFENNPTHFVYELATPTELTTDPVEVESFKGGNNIWCDKDNSSVAVEYRADIELSLQ